MAINATRMPLSYRQEQDGTNGLAPGEARDLPDRPVVVSPVAAVAPARGRGMTSVANKCIERIVVPMPGRPDRRYMPATETV